MDWLTDEMRERWVLIKDEKPKKYPKVFTEVIHCRNCGFTAFYKMNKCVICNEAIKDDTNKTRNFEPNKPIKVRKGRITKAVGKPLRALQKSKKKRNGN